MAVMREGLGPPEGTALRRRARLRRLETRRLPAGAFLRRDHPVVKRRRVPSLLLGTLRLPELVHPVLVRPVGARPARRRAPVALAEVGAAVGSRREGSL
ncbi:hypothetical protein [Rhodococcus sp. NPDC058521]|uniref:hypothetical protein n=1 Tax=Rhodococcus sp. NPDC058521 TaxID=3346536 RepID=UPI0036494731